MLPQKHRVKTEDFTNVLNNGKKIFGEYFTLTYLKNTPHFKASVVISKKIAKKAVNRNMQKRKTREAIRKIFSPLDSSSYPYSCLFFIKKDISEVPLTELTKEISGFSKKLHN
jgi:ribonuclease P protein component